ncbi:MAG: hypothetical protein U0263_41375 [Polyangiaceae bacterium]
MLRSSHWFLTFHTCVSESSNWVLMPGTPALSALPTGPSGSHVSGFVQKFPDAPW